MQQDANGNRVYTIQDIMRLAEIGQFGQHSNLVKGVCNEVVGLREENLRLKALLNEVYGKNG